MFLTKTIKLPVRLSSYENFRYRYD